jgi:hypothetical protein
VYERVNQYSVRILGDPAARAIAPVLTEDKIYPAYPPPNDDDEILREAITTELTSANRRTSALGNLNEVDNP